MLIDKSMNKTIINNENEPEPIFIILTDNATGHITLIQPRFIASIKKIEAYKELSISDHTCICTTFRHYLLVRETPEQIKKAIEEASQCKKQKSK